MADRLKGASTVMLLSIALGRKFEIEWNHPEKIDNIFRTKDYDWRFMDKGNKFQVLDLIDRNFTKEIRKTMKVENISDIIPDKENVKIFCNSIETGISKNENYQLHSKDAISKINRVNLVGTLLSMFDYRPDIEETMLISTFLSKVKKYENCIAVEFRTGGMAIGEIRKWMTSIM